jgi:hypothetical protein
MAPADCKITTTHPAPHLPAQHLTIIPSIQTCPFCLSAPECEVLFHGRAVVFCTNDQCPACPQVTGTILEEAIGRWNYRYYPGYVAREARQ